LPDKRRDTGGIQGVKQKTTVPGYVPDGKNARGKKNRTTQKGRGYVEGGGNGGGGPNRIIEKVRRKKIIEGSM